MHAEEGPHSIRKMIIVLYVLARKKAILSGCHCASYELLTLMVVLTLVASLTLAIDYSGLVRPTSSHLGP
jgi:hypothetical protein